MCPFSPSAIICINDNLWLGNAKYQIWRLYSLQFVRYVLPIRAHVKQVTPRMGPYFTLEVGALGGVLWYFDTYIQARAILGVQSFEFQYFLVLIEKWIFFGVWRFCGYFLGSLQNWTIFRGHFYAFKGVFLRSRYRKGDIIMGCKNFKYFLGCLKFLILFWVEQ